MNGAPAEPRWRRVLGTPLFGGTVAVLGFLVLLWPLVRSPPMRVGAADAFLFGAWAVLIAVLAVIARVTRAAPAHRHDDHDA